MWLDYTRSKGIGGDVAASCSSWHFCDNEQDADQCARLVVTGRKQASAPSLWAIQHAQEPLPEVGDLHVITDWAGVAQCIIRINKVDILPLHAIGEEHARAEGEGDCTLAWWREAHWAYYQRELAGSGHQPQPDMPIVFQRFECVFPPAGVP